MDENILGKIVSFLLKQNCLNSEIDTLYKNGIIDNLTRFKEWIEHDLNFILMENINKKSIVYFIPVS
jgi:hypothetical protein